MNALESLVLGAAQGLTEFLPISSSGHVAVLRMIIERRDGALPTEPPLVLEALLHVGTLLAVIVFYGRDVANALRGAGRAAVAWTRGGLGRVLETDAGANMAVAIVVGSLPTAAIGFVMKRPAEVVAGSPLGLGLCFFTTAIALTASAMPRKTVRRLDMQIALLVGAVQGIAVLPAISRSGVTIVAGLLAGLDREEAARYSFLLSVPAVIGAEIVTIATSAGTSAVRIGAYGAGAGAAFTVGLVSLFILVKLVRRGRLWLFAPYMAAAGAVTLALFD